MVVACRTTDCQAVSDRNIMGLSRAARKAKSCNRVWRVYGGVFLCLSIPMLVFPPLSDMERLKSRKPEIIFQRSRNPEQRATAIFALSLFLWWCLAVYCARACGEFLRRRNQKTTQMDCFLMILARAFGHKPLIELLPGGVRPSVCNKNQLRKPLVQNTMTTAGAGFDCHEVFAKLPGSPRIIYGLA